MKKRTALRKRLLFASYHCYVDGSLLLTLVDVGTGDTYEFRPPYIVCGLWRPVPLQPGESRILYYPDRFDDTLRIPPRPETVEERAFRLNSPAPRPAEAEKPFWRNLGDRIRIRARFRMDANYWLEGEERAKTLASGSPSFVTWEAQSPEIHIKRRSAEEVAKLFNPWPGAAVEKGSKPNRFGGRPVPLPFHALAPPGCDTPHDLLKLEQSLSSGTLRDTVHLLQLATTLYEEKDDARRRSTGDELLKWLDTLPEVERHCLAMTAGNSMTPRDPVAFDLIYGLAGRMPAHYRAMDHRQWYFQHVASSVAFLDYLERKGEREPWIAERRKQLLAPPLKAPERKRSKPQEPPPKVDLLPGPKPSPG